MVYVLRGPLEEGRYRGLIGVYSSPESAKNAASKHAGVTLDRWLLDSRITPGRWFADHPPPFNYMIHTLEINGEPLS